MKAISAEQEKKRRKKNFISHMVQMKETKEQIESEDSLFFISHMVQMKEILKWLEAGGDSKALYPTWFR